MIKHFGIVIFCFFLLFTNLFAEKPKSKIYAAILSIAVPGLGEIYAANKTSGLASMTSEALIWMGYFGCKQQAKWAEQDFKKFAKAYSNSSLANPSESYYDLLQDYYSSDEYNNNVLIYARQGLYSGWDEETYNKFLNTNLYTNNRAWEWTNEDKWIEFGELRRERNKYNIIAKFTVGGLVVNRLVSMVKAVRATYMYNKNIEKKHKNISLQYNVNPYNLQVSLYIQKKF